MVLAALATFILFCCGVLTSLGWVGSIYRRLRSVL